MDTDPTLLRRIIANAQAYIDRLTTPPTAEQKLYNRAQIVVDSAEGELFPDTNWDDDVAATVETDLRTFLNLPVDPDVLPDPPQT